MGHFADGKLESGKSCMGVYGCERRVGIETVKSLFAKQLLAGAVGAGLAFALELLRRDPSFGTSIALWSFFPLVCLLRFGLPAAISCAIIASGLILHFTTTVYGVGDVGLAWLSLVAVFAWTSWSRSGRIIDGILLGWLVVIPLILWRHADLFAFDINAGLLVLTTVLLSQLTPALAAQWMALRPELLRHLWYRSLPFPRREPLSVKLLARLVLFPLALMPALVVSHFFTTEMVYDRGQQLERGSALFVQLLSDRVLAHAQNQAGENAPLASTSLAGAPETVALTLGNAVKQQFQKDYPKQSFDFSFDLLPSEKASAVEQGFLLPVDFKPTTPIDHVYKRTYRRVTASPYPGYELAINVSLSPGADTGLRYSLWGLLASVLLLIGGELLYRRWFNSVNHDFQTFVLALGVWEPGDRPFPSLPVTADQFEELDQVNEALYRLVSRLEATYHSLESVSEERAHLLRRQEEMAESARMASLGEVATGAAHQLNQPLNIIRMAVANIRRQCHFDGEQGAEGLDKLKRIDAQVERAAQIIEGMKAFSVQHHGDWTALMVSDVVTHTLVKLKKQFAVADVEVVRETAPIDAVINSNAVAMETILQSLMGNSLDAFLDREVTDGCIRVAEYQSGEHYTLVMADNAGGIDGSSLNHIFEPFYTTKDASHRPGLGLAVVWRLVDEMGGTIHCENVDGGAKFTLVLPLLNPTQVDLPASA